LENLKPPVLRPVIWLGNSKTNLLEFPKEAQKLIGDELQLMQFGGMPKDAKPFKGVGRGVFEIALRYATDAYRVVLAVKLGDKIYVLHAFQKKSSKGISTPQKHLEMIERRLKQATDMDIRERKGPLG